MCGGGAHLYLYLSHRYMHHSEIIYEFCGITRMKCLVILMKLTVFPFKLVKISLLINVWPKSGVMISHYWVIQFIKMHNPWIPFQVASFGPVVSGTMLSSKSASSIWFENDRAGNFCRFRAEPNQGNGQNYLAILCWSTIECKWRWRRFHLKISHWKEVAFNENHNFSVDEPWPPKERNLGDISVILCRKIGQIFCGTKSEWTRQKQPNPKPNHDFCRSLDIILFTDPTNSGFRL